jgi:hypothetical protein
VVDPASANTEATCSSAVCSSAVCSLMPSPTAMARTPSGGPLTASTPVAVAEALAAGTPTGPELVHPLWARVAIEVSPC